MPEQIEVAAAERVMSAAVAALADPAATSHADYVTWVGRIEDFSKLSATRNLKSYIAALGNAILAKATNPRVDVYSLKASDDSPGAYDARRPVEQVLVPASQRYAFSLGTSGPQPLNNQPFFRAHRIDRNMIVRGDAKPVLTSLITLLHELQQCRATDAAHALAAFVAVRKTYMRKYEPATGLSGLVTWRSLADAIQSLVSEKSEGGSRAQACAGGLLDSLYTPALVRVGKRNEPDRRMPGDVGVRSNSTEDSPFIAVFEVRDKNVPDHSVIALALKAAEAGVLRVTLVAVAAKQVPLDVGVLRERALELGVDLRIFVGWSELVDQVVFASSSPEMQTVAFAVQAIRARMIELEVSPAAVEKWAALTT